MPHLHTCFYSLAMVGHLDCALECLLKNSQSAEQYSVCVLPAHCSHDLTGCAYAHKVYLFVQEPTCLCKSLPVCTKVYLLVRESLIYDMRIQV